MHILYRDSKEWYFECWYGMQMSLYLHGIAWLSPHTTWKSTHNPPAIIDRRGRECEWAKWTINGSTFMFDQYPRLRSQRAAIWKSQSLKFENVYSCETVHGRISSEVFSQDALGQPCLLSQMSYDQIYVPSKVHVYFILHLLFSFSIYLKITLLNEL